MPDDFSPVHDPGFQLGLGRDRAVRCRTVLSVPTYVSSTSRRSAATADASLGRNSRITRRSIHLGHRAPGKSPPTRVRADAQVLETGVDGERHDHRVGAEALGQAVRADDVGARRDAGEDALLLGEPASSRPPRRRRSAPRGRPSPDRTGASRSRPSPGSRRRRSPARDPRRARRLVALDVDAARLERLGHAHQRRGCAEPWQNAVTRPPLCSQIRGRGGHGGAGPCTGC